MAGARPTQSAARRPEWDPRAPDNIAPVVTWLTAPDNHRAQAVYNRVGGTSGTFLEYELELGG